MKAAVLEKIAANRIGSRGDFPFGFRREARARPLRVCVGFVIANVTDRFVPLDATPAGECVVPPLTIALLPVQRGIPAVGGELVPSVRQPKLSVLVATIADEFEILAIRY